MMSRARGACEVGGKEDSAHILAVYTEKKLKVTIWAYLGTY